MNEKHPNHDLYFASSPSVETVRDLLARGADPNFAVFPGGETTFLGLAGQVSADTLQLLLEAGADVHRKHISGTALHAVCRHGPTDMPAQVEILVRAGATVDAIDDGGRTPLAFACNRGPAAAVRVLLAAGANPNARSRAGTTPLHGIRGDLEITGLLLDAGADPNGADADGETPLHAVVSRGIDNAAAVVERLVQRGAHLDARTTKGWTPLRLAVLRRNVPIARLLVDLGADPHAADINGVSPLQFAFHIADAGMVTAVGGEAGHAALLQREKDDVARIAALEEEILSTLASGASRFIFMSQGFKGEYDNTDEVWCAGHVWNHRFTDGYTEEVREQVLTRNDALPRMRALVTWREDSPLQILERIRQNLHAIPSPSP